MLKADLLMADLMRQHAVKVNDSPLCRPSLWGSALHASINHACQVLLSMLQGAPLVWGAGRE